MKLKAGVLLLIFGGLLLFTKMKYSYILPAEGNLALYTILITFLIFGGFGLIENSIRSNKVKDSTQG